ncbi:MAG TPA: dienelactone hydrolase family protein [Thermoanaerobaculia bacterium]|nr:dienelactone hydrolase family protein [Thermoanaerobaculia bacterium]
MKHGFLISTAALLLAGSASAKVVTKPVAYEHAGVKLEGFLAYDDAKAAAGKLPGVLVLPEWWGLTAYPKARAEELARMGYVAFAADMYGAGVTTDDAKKAGELAGPFYGKPLMAERARAGLDQLLKSGLVDPARVAAIGFCFGGSAAQALAYTGAPLAGMVSFHGGPVNAPPEAAGKVKAKFLLLNGAVDPMVKPEAKAALEKSLEDAGIDYVSIDFGSALHAFSNPGATEVAKKNGLTAAIGYNERAARRAWKAMEVLFAGIFEGRR